MKGTATRLLVYEEPAVRACFDIDLLVRPGDRVAAARVLTGLGYAAVADAAGRLQGVVTAGDLTRLMERQEGFFDVAVASVMTSDPRTTSPDELGAAAVGTMERCGIMALPVLDDERRVVGMVHLHDLMRAGAV